MPDESTKILTPGPLETAGYAVYELPDFGDLWIAWVPEGLVMVRFSGEPPGEAERARWLSDLDGLEELPIPALLDDTLRRYFAGEPVDPADLPVRMVGTKFQRKTWTALRGVGRGEVRTYKGLAKDVRSPRAMRAIGMAMGANPIPIVIPCHRVVGAGFALGGFSGGLDKKRFLLELEGVRVDGDRVRPRQLGLLDT